MLAPFAAPSGYRSPVSVKHTRESHPRTAASDVYRLLPRECIDSFAGRPGKDESGCWGFLRWQRESRRAPVVRLAYLTPVRNVGIGFRFQLKLLSPTVSIE